MTSVPNTTRRKSSDAYITRTPECTVLLGYRYWLSGCVHANQSFFEKCDQVHVSTLGPEHGSVASSALATFLETLGVCATCPLRFINCQKYHLCRDECLVLSLIAGIQHGDDDVQKIAAETLTCPTKAGPVIANAGTYAFALKTGGSVLTPIPLETIQHIIIDDAASTVSVRSNSLH